MHIEIRGSRQRHSVRHPSDHREKNHFGLTKQNQKIPRAINVTIHSSLCSYQSTDHSFFTVFCPPFQSLFFGHIGFHWSPTGYPSQVETELLTTVMTQKLLKVSFVFAFPINILISTDQEISRNSLSCAGKWKIAENFLESGEPVRPVKCSVVFNFSLCAIATALRTLYASLTWRLGHLVTTCTRKLAEDVCMVLM